MKIKLAALAALFAACGSSISFGGPVVDAATRAEALQAQGQTVQALDALNEAIDAIWTAGPLAFRKVVIVNSSHGYGDYEERADKTFKPDEKLKVHVEPVGYGYGTADGKTTISLTADLSFENATGQVLGEAKDVFSISAPSAVKKREFSMMLSFGVPYLRPGDYKAVFTVHDQNSDKTGTFDVPFTIALPTAN